MRTSTKRILTIALLVGVAAAGSLFLAPAEEAGALPPFSRLVDYYSDATYTVDVGWFFRSCSGGASSGGSTSSYYVTEFDYWCTGGGCCIKCSTGPCPQNVLDSYPCGEC